MEQFMIAETLVDNDDSAAAVVNMKQLHCVMVVPHDVTARV